MFHLRKLVMKNSIKVHVNKLLNVYNKSTNGHQKEELKKEIQNLMMMSLKNYPSQKLKHWQNTCSLISDWDK